MVWDEAPHASAGETSMVRCLCGLIRDVGESLDRERWVAGQKYRKTCGVNPVNGMLNHTIVPCSLILNQFPAIQASIYNMYGHI